jgi:uncharacterized protein
MARLELRSHGIEESTDYGSTPDALFQLGLMYCVGRDVELDLVEAHKWFNLAAMRGNDDAKRYRFEISREMSRPQVSRAQRLAREWIATHYATKGRRPQPASTVAEQRGDAIPRLLDGVAHRFAGVVDGFACLLGKILHGIRLFRLASWR